MSESLYNRKSILSLVLLLGITATAWGGNRFRQNPANSYITLSVGGGESNTMSDFTIADSKDLAGGDAFVGLGFEVRKNNFFFGFGAQADFDYTRQRLGDFVEQFDRVDFENDPHTYSYRYSKFTDAQRNLQIGVPVYFGMYFGKYVYATIGGKFAYPVLSSHSANTRLSTDGYYPRYYNTIENTPTYGFYAQDYYTCSGSATQEMKVGPTVELGARIPLHSRGHRIGLRLGAYFEYLFPLKFTDDVPLIDYSQVDVNPLTQNQEQLRQSIVFNSAITSQYQNSATQFMSAGLKFTILFNVSPVRHICNCEPEPRYRRR